MRRRRQQKLEKKLQQFRSKDGGPDTGEHFHQSLLHLKLYKKNSRWDLKNLWRSSLQRCPVQNVATVHSGLRRGCCT